LPRLAVGAGRFEQPRRSEIPFELPSHRALAFGDTVLEVDSERRRSWYEQRFLPTLEALTRLDVERVLVTHGDPVLRDGARELAASLYGRRGAGHQWSDRNCRPH